MLLSAGMMLRHLGLADEANSLEGAVAFTLAHGPRTGDIAARGEGVGTQAFTDAVIRNLGSAPDGWKPRPYRPLRLPDVAEGPDRSPDDRLRAIGVDVFVDSHRTPAELGAALERAAEGTPVRLKMISNRGTLVYPVTGTPTDCVDHWRCRFVLKERGGVSAPAAATLLDLVRRVAETHRFMHVEKLYELDGNRAYSLGQGED
jgi:isocitrate dehydrogenase